MTKQKKVYRTQVTLPEREGDWLKAHPEYSASGLLLAAVRREMAKEKQFAERQRW